MKKIVLSILIIVSLFSCINRVEKKGLPTDKFKYSEELKKTMKTLETISKLTSLEKGIPLVETKDFVVTNKYVIPFLYSQMLAQSIPIDEYSKKQIESILVYTAKDRALNQILYEEALEKGVEVNTVDIMTIMERFTDGAAISEFKITLEKSPFTYEFVFEDATRIATIEKYKDLYIINKVTVDEDEAKKYYKDNIAVRLRNPKVVVRHILFSTNGLNETDKEKQKEKLNKLRQEIIKGADFAKYAMEYSDDIASNRAGGLMGEYIEKNQIMDNFDKVVFNTKEGEITEVFETEFGYHIAKVEKIQYDKEFKYEEVKDEIYNYIKLEKELEAMDYEIERVKKKYQFKILVEGF